jgi:hypothetical protein
MHALPFAFAFALIAAQEQPAAPPQEGTPPPAAPASPAAPQTVAQQVAALQQEYDAANDAFGRKYQAAKTDEEKSKLFESDYPKAESYAPRFLALAAQAKGEPAALDCYLWIMQHQQMDRDRAPIYPLLVADHVKSPKLVDAVRLLGRYTPSVAAEKFLRAVIEKSPHDAVKGAANYSLAGVLLALSELCETMASPAWTPETAQRNEGYYGKATLDEMAARDGQELAKEAEDLLEDVAAAAKSHKGQESLAAQATGDLFEMRNLAVGQAAPDVSGFDVDTVPFKLADYRGKVVVLDFWGFW